MFGNKKTERFESEISTLYQYLLNRLPTREELNSFANNKKINDLKKQQIAYQIFLSAESLIAAKEHAIDIHLYCIHNARLKMVMCLLPEASVIVDLGGANGSIYDMGYSYSFQSLTIVDLPPEKRCEMYKDIEMKPIKTGKGPIYIKYSSMTDLSYFKDSSVDLVWSGQSIEHISEEEAARLYSEVQRILKPDGFFCLDTPNRLLTEIHTSWTGAWIHPEHKIEYYPHQLKKNLSEHGFRILDEKGICEMLNTWKTKKFDYADFVLGNPISDAIEASYIQYYKCQKI